MSNIKIYGRTHRLNRVINEIDGLYHVAALHLGLSDSVTHVLYMLYDGGGSCPLSAITSTGICKQTVNSAVRKLESEGLLYLEKHHGKGKLAVLTEKGLELSRSTVARLLEAEENAFAGWTDEELETYITLNQKCLDGLRVQIEALAEKK